MKKEVALAILIGIAVGLVITFGISTANKSLRQAAALAKISPSPAPSSQVSPTPTPETSPSSIPLNISAPADELLTTQNSVSVTGKTSPLASVVVLSETSEQIVTSDTAGNFTAKVTLEGGYNRITITAFDSAGQSASTNLLVTYTTSKI